MIDGKYNQKADVYSFGILLSELILGKSAFSHVNIEWSLQFIKQFTNREISPLLPKSIEEGGEYPDAIVKLIQSCLSWDSDDRPTFDDIFNSLKNFKKGFSSL